MTENKKWILAVDPGSKKVGYAVVNYDLTHGEMSVVYISELHKVFNRLCSVKNDLLPSALVIGNGTAAKVIHDLFNSLEISLPVYFVDEKNTTYKARGRYFIENPPTGLWRIVPLSFQTPAIPIDDYAAWLIGEKYLKDRNFVFQD